MKGGDSLVAFMSLQDGIIEGAISGHGGESASKITLEELRGPQAALEERIMGAVISSPDRSDYAVVNQEERQKTKESTALAAREGVVASGTGGTGTIEDNMGVDVPHNGGRSRSRKRSASKRTRRKGVAKKQKSKKNKRQSRRKVRRASSRRSRK